MNKMLCTIFVVLVSLSLLGSPVAFAQGSSPTISLSTYSGAPGERVTLSANMTNLLCSIYDSSGIDTISTSLGRTDIDTSNLTFTVPDWDAGRYSISCSQTSGSSVVATSNSVTFTITGGGAGLEQPSDYFGDNWQPPWVIPISNEFSTVGSTSQRVRQTRTFSSGGVDFTMAIDAANGDVFNRYILTTTVYFEVRSEPTNFQLRTDSYSVDACPLPAAMVIGHMGWILPDPPLENRVRENPGYSGRVIGAIQPGEQFEVLDGPECRDGTNWWYVRGVDGALGWTAEGENGVYYAETFAEVDVVISASHRDPTSQSNVLYFYIDPVLDRLQSHRYRSEDDYGASIRLRTMEGEVRLSFWRSSPAGSYYRSTTSRAVNYTGWLQHDSGNTLANYSARVMGQDSGRNEYRVYGTLELR